MERKTADFFDWDKVNMSKVMQQFSQHPDKMDQIMDFVINKKEHLKEKYDHKLKDLYAEYMEE